MTEEINGPVDPVCELFYLKPSLHTLKPFGENPGKFTPTRAPPSRLPSNVVPGSRKPFAAQLRRRCTTLSPSWQTLRADPTSYGASTKVEDFEIFFPLLLLGKMLKKSTTKRRPVGNVS